MGQNKTLRADMEEESFYKFKGLFGRLGVDTNDEAIEALVEYYEETSKEEVSKDND